MRHIILLCTLFLFLTSARAQYVAILDSNFGNWLDTSGYHSCLIGNGTIGYQLDTTCNYVLYATNIDCRSSNILDFTCIQYFKNLKYLTCTGTMSSMPFLPIRLTSLVCGGVNLISLPNLPVGLTFLNCSFSLLTNLPPLPVGLTRLYCNNNHLTSLPSLPVGLSELECTGNQLTNLPILPVRLTSLGCSDNQLTSLPTLPEWLYFLNCRFNNLTSLPNIPARLIDFDCQENPSLSCLPYFHQNALRLFYIYGTAITCLPNRFTAQYYDVKPDTIPLCTPSSACPTLSTSILDPAPPAPLHLYPNPNTGTFTLQSDGLLHQSYTIYNLLGQAIASDIITMNNQTITLSGIVDGVYILEVKGVSRLKIVLDTRQ